MYCHVCRRGYGCSCAPKRYGCLHFVFDATMVVFTGGLWLIRIFVREMRRRPR